ncbi:MAG: ArnT family glycosyltransferase [Vicinamibacterales bacterium]
MARLLDRRVLLGALCALVAIVLSARELWSESYVYTHGDSPRYMMNALFILDVLRDWPFDSLSTFREYATLYYARYPALSLGHHPPLTSVLEVPFFAVMGVSVTATRLPQILSLVVGVVFLYRLVTELSDEWAGAVAGLAMAASPGLIELTQGVMSEPPAVALTVVAAFYLHRFCVTQQRGALVLFTAATILSVWAKQNTIVALPAFALYGLVHLGWRRIVRADVLAAAMAIAVLAGSMVAVTAAISTVNVRRSTFLVRAAAGNAPIADGEGRMRLVRTTGRVIAATPEKVAYQMTTAAAVVGLLGLVVMVVQRRREAWLFVPWVITTFAFILIVTRLQEIWRYGIYWIPPLAASAGMLCADGRWRRPALGVMAAVLAGQVVAASGVRVKGMGGYEDAARFVVEHPKGSTVMFSGDIDSGYFMFFVRKHDPDRRQVVLRSDKIFTVSNMRQIAVANRIESPDEIGPTLRRLGVGYVVIEDRKSDSAVQEWLRTELRTGPYVERQRIRIETTDFRLEHTDLVVYEPTNLTAPAPDARLDLRLPIVSQQLDVPLADLLSRKHLN